MRKSPVLSIIILIAAVCLASSCAPRLGWGLVLWSLPDASVPTGSIVPVYIKSDIGRVYVIGIPSSPGHKIEVEQWRIELFRTRAKAQRRVKEMAEYLDVFMSATRDGVPLRYKPTNAEKRVFKLRQGQVVKVFAKVEGESVTTGGKTLPGDWYLVMADDGTKGYVFSYAMKLYHESESLSQGGTDSADFSSRIDAFFRQTWRPAYFRDMIESGSIDLDRFSRKFGLFTDAVRKQIRIELPGQSIAFAYDSISESSGAAVFEGSSSVGIPLVISFQGEDRILARWTDSQEFTVLAQDIDEEIKTEKLARQDRLLSFVSAAASAERLPATSPSVSFTASEAGKFTFGVSGKFSWAGMEALPAGFVPQGAGDSGRIAIRFGIDDSLRANWDGVLSLDFSDADSSWTDYFYRLSPDGLVLARAVMDPAMNRATEVDQTAGTVAFPINR